MRMSGALLAECAEVCFLPDWNCLLYTSYRFTPERENIYTAEEPRSMTDMLTKAPMRFSAVDCPVCGCQIARAIRAPRIDFPAIVERHDADAEETEGGEDED